MSNQNELMNKLIRQNAPETASDPMGKPADDAGNEWFRNSVKDAQAERVDSMWARLMDAHKREREWAERLADGGNGNGNG